MNVNLLRLLRLAQTRAPELREHLSLVAELLQIEWQAERRRITTLILVTAGALIAGALFLALCTGVILAAVWQTPYRTLAVIVLLVLYAAAFAVAWGRMRTLALRSEERFAATKSELRRDLARLRIL